MGYNFNRPKFSTGSQPLMVRDVLRASKSLDFPSIAAAGTATLTITVPGAEVGDDVVLVQPQAPTSALVLVGYVTAADTVTVMARNLTGSAIDQAATTYRVIVFKAY